VTEKRNEEDEDVDAGLIGGGGPAETIDGDDDEELDEHGDNLREADPGER
jgi:hypothetical protein